MKRCRPLRLIKQSTQNSDKERSDIEAMLALLTSMDLSVAILGTTTACIERTRRLSKS